VFRGVVLYEGLFFFLFDAEGVLCLSYANLAGVPGKTAGVSPILASDWDTYVRDNFDALKAGHIVCTSGTRPTGLVAGDEGLMIFETDTDKFLVWDGSSWVSAINSGSLNFSWQTWTPVLRVNSTNVTLGTGSTSTGRYLKMGPIVFAEMYIEFGTSGVSVPSGGLMDIEALPVAPSGQTNAVAPIGTVWGRDISNYGFASIGVMTANRNFYSHGSTSAWTNFVPFTWSTEDAIRATLAYECAA